MNTDTWQRVEAIFERVVAAPAAQRAALLDDACGSDAALRAEVESLLEHDTSAGEDFLSPPALPFELVEGDVPAWAQALVGRALGRYTIVRLIGHGGMGCVFEAQQEHPHRAVALKVLPPGFSAPAALARFRLEPEMLGRLQHPHIAQVYEAGVHEDATGLVPYFAMEFIPDAQPLIEYANAHSLSTREKLGLFATICDAVHHGHQKGIIHRDLKPANLLVSADGVPKVIDFGVARASDADIMLTTQHTHVGDLLGTVHYMSPEQCDGNPAAIDTRTDVYALGVVLYELLTGVAPYETSGTTLYAAIRVVKEQPPRRPSLVHRQFRGDLEAILLKTLEKEPARRYASAADLVQDLRRHLAGEPIDARPPTLAYVASRYARRHVWQTTSAALGVVFVIVVLAAIAIQASLRAENAIARAEKQTAERAAYRGVLQSAEVALALDDASMARQYLERITEPNQCASWEWRHLMARTDVSLKNLLLPGQRNEVSMTAVDASGRRLAQHILPDDRIDVYEIATGALVFQIKHAVLEGWVRQVVPKEARANGGWVETLGISLALSPTGDRLAVSAFLFHEWSAIILFDLAAPASSDPIGWYASEGVPIIAFHPRRALLVGGYVADVGGTEPRGLLVWDLETKPGATGAGPSPGIPVARVDCGESHQGWASFSPDGRWFATTQEYGPTVSVWDFEQILSDPELAKPLVLSGHTRNLNNLAFSADSSLLATCSTDRTVRIWDIARCLSAPRTASGVVRAVDAGAIELTGPTAAVRRVTFCRPNTVVASDGDGLLTVWRARDTNDPVAAGWERVNTLHGHRQREVAVFSIPDGTVLSAARDGDVRLWEPFVEELPRLRGHGTSVSAVACLPDNRSLISGDGAQALYVWDAKSGAPAARVATPPDERVANLVCWKDKQARCLVAAAYAEANPLRHGRVVVWDLTDGAKPRIELEHPASAEERAVRGFCSLAVSADGGRLAAGDQRGVVDILDLAAGPDKATVATQIRAGTDVVFALVFLDAGGRWLVTGAGHRNMRSPPQGPALRLWDITRGSDVPLEPATPPDTSVFDLALSPDRTLLAAATRTGAIQVYRITWSSGPPALHDAATLHGHVDRVLGVAFHPQQPRLLSCGDDRLLRVWDTHSWTEVVALHGADGALDDLAVDPTGQRVLTACIGFHGDDNTVALWESDAQLEVRARRARVAEYFRPVLRAARDFAGLLDELPAFLAARAREEGWPPEVLEAAQRDWALALLLYPSNALNAGWGVVNTRDLSDDQYQRVIGHAERLAEHFPWNAEVHALLGAARYRRSDFEGAYAALMRAQALIAEETQWNPNAPSLGVGHAYLAMTAARLGRAMEARDALDAYRAWTSQEACAASLEGLAAEIESVVTSGTD